MPTYTLAVTGAADGHQHTTLTDFRADAEVIDDVKHVLTAEHSTIAIGRGAEPAVESLGAWDWCNGQPRWTAEE